VEFDFEFAAAGLQILRRIFIYKDKFLWPSPWHVRLSALIRPPPSSMVKFDIGNILQKNSQETLHTVKIRQQYRALYIPIYVGYLLLTSVRNTL